MKVACVLLPDFEVAVEISRRPELAGRPVVVGGLPHERKTVRSRSPEAAAFGVAKGMPLRQARGLCPDATFLPPDDELYRETLGGIIRVLDTFTPTLEVDGCHLSAGVLSHAPLLSEPRTRTPETDRPSPLAFYLDASGLELLFGPDQELAHGIAAAVQRATGLRPGVGLGSSKFVARMAAHRARAGSALVVKEGDEQPFLAPLPVELLPCSEEAQRRMWLLGFRTLGQLANLPRGALAEQFGPEGAEIHRLARGIDERPLIPREIPTLLEEEAEIDPPTVQIDILLSIAKRPIRRLVARMRSGYLACREVALHLGFSDGPTLSLDTTLHERTDREGDLTRAVERLVDRVPANKHLASSLRVSLSGFGGHCGEQLELFGSRADSLQRVQRVLREMREQFGEGAFRPLAETGERMPQGIHIGVALDGKGEPGALLLGNRRERVREVCNRWRVEDDWWRREVRRDYYRLITESGKLCIVYRELPPSPPTLEDLSPLPAGVESISPWFLDRIYA